MPESDSTAVTLEAVGVGYEEMCAISRGRDAWTGGAGPAAPGRNNQTGGSGAASAPA